MNGWKVSSAFIRYGAASEDFEDGAPPQESVRSEKTILPEASQGRVNSSSVPTSTLPRLMPDALTEPSVGRPELCISITGCAVPATPPPATRIGTNGVALRSRLV